VLYTDGFSEAMDSARDLYTDHRLARLLAESSDTAAAALVGHAVADVRAFASADANPDDMTMLIVHVTK
jgi:serine phosphatase RsbU (regulator of sigma subunit)